MEYWCITQQRASPPFKCPLIVLMGGALFCDEENAKPKELAFSRSTAMIGKIWVKFLKECLPYMVYRTWNAHQLRWPETLRNGKNVGGLPAACHSPRKRTADQLSKELLTPLKHDWTSNLMAEKEGRIRIRDHIVWGIFYLQNLTLLTRPFWKFQSGRCALQLLLMP